MTDGYVLDRSPARLSARLAAGAAFLSLVAVGPLAWAAMVLGTLGVAAVVAGVVRGSRAAVGVGGIGLGLGTIAAGIGGAGALPLLVGATAAVLAWDAGLRAIGIGEQLGREAETTRLELVHAGASAAVGLSAVAFGYGLYRGTAEGGALSVLVFLALAAVLIASALR